MVVCEDMAGHHLQHEVSEGNGDERCVEAVDLGRAVDGRDDTSIDEGQD